MKRLFALLLCCLLLVSLCPPASAEAGAAPHSCGDRDFETPLHGDLSGTLAPGSYYLDGPGTLKGHVRITGEVSLCLNGFSISAQGSSTFMVCDGGVFNLYDCTGEGLVGAYQTTQQNNPLTIQKGGTVNLYGGRLYSKLGANPVNSQGTLNVYGGRIDSEGNYLCAVRNEGVVNLYGGRLTGHVGISQRYGAVLNLCGDDFVIDAGALAFQYVTATAPLVIQTESYRWRTDAQAEFSLSEDAPYVYDPKGSYVEFEPLYYPLSFELDGGTVQGALPGQYRFGEGCPLPSAVTREGYLFTGWMISDGGGYVSEVGADRSGPLTLWAMYEPAPVVTVSEAPEVWDEIPVETDPLDGSFAAPLFLAILGAAMVVLVVGVVLVLRRWKDDDAVL